jgi:hypothetical protein
LVKMWRSRLVWFLLGKSAGKTSNTGIFTGQPLMSIIDWSPVAKYILVPICSAMIQRVSVGLYSSSLLAIILET